MAKVVFDNNLINANIIDDLNNSINILNQLIDIADNTRIPDRFGYDWKFRDYIYDLKEARRIYIEKRDLIISFNKKIGTILNNMSENLYNIKSVEIRKRVHNVV